MFTFTSKL